MIKELISSYLNEYGIEYYDMPDHQLELMMDDHECISWEGKEYFIPDYSMKINEDDELIYEFLVSCYHV